MTTAEKIAERLGNDGLNMETKVGTALDELAREERARIEKGEEHNYGSRRYTFPDGSVITTSGGNAWGLGYRDCWCWQGRGNEHQEGCAQDRNTRARVVRAAIHAARRFHEESPRKLPEDPWSHQA